MQALLKPLATFRIFVCLQHPTTPPVSFADSPLLRGPGSSSRLHQGIEPQRCRARRATDIAFGQHLRLRVLRVCRARFRLHGQDGRTEPSERTSVTVRVFVSSLLSEPPEPPETWPVFIFSSRFANSSSVLVSFFVCVSGLTAQTVLLCSRISSIVLMVFPPFPQASRPLHFHSFALYIDEICENLSHFAKKIHISSKSNKTRISCNRPRL